MTTHRTLMTSWRVLAVSALLLPLSAATPAAPRATRTPPSSPLVTTRPPTLPAGVSQDWFSQATKNIQQSEYHFSATADGHFSAPNRAQNLRTTATADGLTLTDRTAAAAWQLTLRLTAWGRAEALMPVEPVVPTATENRLEYRHPGVTAWYVNREAGLEQGFTIPAPPGYPQKSSDDFSSVVLELAFSEALHATRSADGQTLTFTDTHGAHVLDYGQLHVTDATGQTLPAKLTLTAPHTFQLQVDDRGAQYPLTVDPLMTTPAWSVTSGQDNAEFGYSVATAGDVNGDGFSDVLVGAPMYDNGELDEGAAFVFLGSAGGLSATPIWTAESNQARPNPSTNIHFADAVATAGDVNGDGYSDILVGASFYQRNLLRHDGGTVFLWLGGQPGTCGASPASGLGPCGTPANATWRADSNQDDSDLGSAVATAGDVNGDGFSDIIIGSWAYTTTAGLTGAAFVWFGGRASTCGAAPPSGLGPCGTPANATWRAEGDQAPEHFGRSVATAGDVNGDGYSDVLVGVPFYSNPEIQEGRVLVWLGSAAGLGPSGTPTNAAWRAESNQARATFGDALSTAGDVNGDGFSDVLIGARSYKNPDSYGAAFVWLGGQSGSCGAAPPSGLGSCGVPGNAAWRAHGSAGSSYFGHAVSTAGDVNGDGFSDIVIGEYWSAGNSGTAAGIAYAWFGSAGGLGTDGDPTNADWQVESDQSYAWFGWSVATAGDVNGDGFSDVLVGARGYDRSSSTDNSGAAFCYYGSAAGLAPTAAWTAEGDQVGAALGGSVASAGDVNGDGYSDVIIGAPAYDNGEPDEGRAFLFSGYFAGLIPMPTWTAESNQAGALFGGAVATAGDVNGDGFSDVVIGAVHYTNGQPNEGAAFVWYGGKTGVCGANSPAGLGACGNALVGSPGYNADWRAESNQSGGGGLLVPGFGGGVASAGDVNGDGFSDLAVAASSYDNGQAGEGAVFVWRGGPTGLGPTGTPANAAWMAESNLVLAQFGTGLASAGDVNGDGFSDILIGAPRYITPTGIQGGSVWLWLGGQAGTCNGQPASGIGSCGTPANAPWSAASDQTNAYFGTAVASAGDVNGDGFSDILVGAPHYQTTFLDEGAAFLWLGGQPGTCNGTLLTGLGPCGTPQNARWRAVAENQAAILGGAVASAGDVNDDGYADMLVGADGYEGPTPPAQGRPGAAFVWHGSPALRGIGTPLTADWKAYGETKLSAFGWAVASAGDVNGDGFSDVLVGAYRFQGPEVDEGKAYLYYGNLGDGLDRIPHQLRRTSSAPIALLGKTDAPTQFRLGAFGRTPLGRGRVKLQWEVKPLSVPFNWLGMQSAATWTDTGVPDPNPQIGSRAPLTDVVTSLLPTTPYHWRLRIKSTSPFFPWSPWLTIQGNNRTEEKVRTP